MMRALNVVAVSGLFACMLLQACAQAGTPLSFVEYPGPPSPSDGYYVPCYIATGPDGNLWFTENYGLADIGRITPGGALTLFPVPSRNSEGGIAAGPDGNLWFTEYRTNKIGRVTPDGVFTEFPIPSAGPLGNGTFPWDIAAGPDGSMWFVETVANQIGRITADGDITEFPIPSSGSYYGGTFPGGICAGPDGNMWFVELHGDQVGRITPSGNITEFPIPTPDCYPIWITCGPDGNLWFTEWSACKIGSVTTDGVFAEYVLPSVDNKPYHIAAGPDGNLWYTLYEDTIGRITPAGVITEFQTPSAGRLGGLTTGPDGNLWFLESTANKIVKVLLARMSLTSPSSGRIGDPVTLSATLMRSDDSVVAGETLHFTLGSDDVGTAVTDAGGKASVQLRVPESSGVGPRTITVHHDATAACGETIRTATMSVTRGYTALSIYPITVARGQTFGLRTLMYCGGKPIVGRTLQFYVDGAYVGEGVSDASGAAVAYTAPPAMAYGSHNVTASFAGDTTYLPAFRTAPSLTVGMDTKLSLYPATGTLGQPVVLRSILINGSTRVAGRKVTFAVDSIAADSGTTDADGIAQTTWTIPLSLGTGIHNVTATFDGSSDPAYSSTTRTAPVLTVCGLRTSISFHTATGYAGGSVNLRCLLVSGGSPVAAKSVSFLVDGKSAGSGATDATGLASVSYAIPANATLGTHSVSASFDGSADTTYASTTRTASVLTVLPPKANVAFSLYAVSGAPGQTVTLKTLVYSGGVAASGLSVQFAVDGTPIGLAVSSANGATRSYTIPIGAALGAHNVTVSFAGDAAHNAATRTSAALTVVSPKANVAFSLFAVSGTPGQTVTLKTQVYSGGVAVSGLSVQFAVDGTPIGSAVSSANGAARSYTIPLSMGIGPHNVTVSFVGDATHNSATRTTAALSVK